MAIKEEETEGWRNTIEPVMQVTQILTVVTKHGSENNYDYYVQKHR